MCTNFLARLTIAAACGLGTLTAGVAVAQQPAPSEAAVTIKPKFEKGQEYRFRVQVDRTDTNKLMNAPAPASAEPGTEEQKPQPIAVTSRAALDTEQVLRVVETAEAGATLELEIASIKANVEIPAGKFAYDSTKPEDDKDRDNIALQTYKPIVGVKFTLKTDADGAVTDITGNSEYQGLGSMAAYLQLLTGTENLRSRLNMMLVARRGDGVAKIGDTWSNVETTPFRQINANFEVLMNSTLRSVADGTASVDTTGGMRFLPINPDGKMEWSIKDPSLLASAVWSTTDGIVKTLTVDQSFQLKGSAMGMEVERRTVLKTVVDRM